MTSKLSAILCVPLLFSSHALFANNISFNYLDIHYSQFEFDDDVKASHGIGVEGSYQFYGPFYVNAAYAYTDHEKQVDNKATKTKITPLTLGIGARHDFTPNTTGYGSFSWIEADWGKNEVSMDQFEIGVRSQIMNDLELQLAITSSKISDFKEHDHQPCYTYNEEYEVIPCERDDFSRNTGYKIGLNIELPNYSALTAQYSMIAGDLDLAQIKIGFRTSF